MIFETGDRVVRVDGKGGMMLVIDASVKWVRVQHCDENVTPLQRKQEVLVPELLVKRDYVRDDRGRFGSGSGGGAKPSNEESENAARSGSPFKPGDKVREHNRVEVGTVTGHNRHGQVRVDVGGRETIYHHANLRTSDSVTKPSAPIAAIQEAQRGRTVINPHSITAVEESQRAVGNGDARSHARAVAAHDAAAIYTSNTQVRAGEKPLSELHRAAAQFHRDAIASVIKPSADKLPAPKHPNATVMSVHGTHHVERFSRENAPTQYDVIETSTGTFRGSYPTHEAAGRVADGHSSRSLPAAHQEARERNVAAVRAGVGQSDVPSTVDRLPDGRYDYRSAGQHGLFVTSSKYPPKVGGEVDFADKNGNKVQGRVEHIGNGNIHIRQANNDGYFKGPLHVMRMIAER